jgi:3-oxoacyl-[acyl-carrier-protein] synthase II
VNGHGTATKAGDLAESWATYNALGACGCIEAWVSVQMVNRKWFALTLNLNIPDPECAPLDYIQGAGRDLDCEYYMSNNFAFGGINTSLMFRRV